MWNARAKYRDGTEIDKTLLNNPLVSEEKQRQELEAWYSVNWIDEEKLPQ